MEKKLYTPENYCMEESVGYLIGHARAVLVARLDRALAELEMTHAQYCIFRRLLDAENGMTTGDLAREGHYDTGAMTRMLDRLEEKGFICRQRSEADRRVVQVCLSDKGRALADRMGLVTIDVLNKQLRGFSPEELEQFKTLLRRLISNG